VAPETLTKGNKEETELRTKGSVEEAVDLEKEVDVDKEVDVEKVDVEKEV
jgi:hypothetical protein